MRVVPTGLNRAAVVGLLVALVVAVGGPAYAGDHGHVSVTPDGPSGVTVTGSDSTSSTSPGHSGSAGSSNSTPASYGSSSPAAPPPPATWDQMMTNDPNADLSNEPGAVDSCGSDWGGDGWNAQYAQPTPCAPTDDPKPGEPPAKPRVTTEMVVEAARLTAPTSPPHVEPGTVSYVNIPNNYWTESPTVRDSVTVVGKTIPLVWTPTGTTWDFGDGGSATGDGIQGADVGAPGAIEHSYARQGSYDISTTTTYNLSFVLPGQGAQTISLTAPPSPPVTLPVREIQTVVDTTR
jgi:hypothetical protein